MTQVLYIMQGVPGSGKSFLASLIKHGDNDEKPVVCSTDTFFYVNGVYKFDPTKLPEYHAKNLNHAIRCMDAGYSVVVDNTNIRRWQCREYVRHAVAKNIPIIFVRVDGRFSNEHGVPQEIVERLRSEMQELTVESVLASKSPWEI